MKSVTVSAPGKVIIMGDHAVVHGKPGLIAAIDKRCRVELIVEDQVKSEGITQEQGVQKSERIKKKELRIKDEKQERGRVEIYSKQLDQRIITTVAEMTEKTKQARKMWQEYEKSGSIETLKKITENPLDLAQYAVIETFAALKKQFQGNFKIEIDSQIPIGSGLGSSAALSVGIVGAISYLLTGGLDKHLINDTSYTVEHRIHGMPSGADSAAATFGGLVWFRKETPFLKLISSVGIEVPKQLQTQLWLMQTGQPQENTGEMVALVKKLKFDEPTLVNTFLEDQEYVTRGLLNAVKEVNSDQLITLIRRGEENLEKIGVVSASTQTLIRQIEASGGAAKICGGGGKAKASGIVLIFHPQPLKLKAVLKTIKLPAIQVKLGEEGVRVEQG